MSIGVNTNFGSYYNNLFSPKKAVNSNQSQFSQNANNKLSESSVSNVAPKVTLYKDALFSTHNASGASAHVYYDEMSGMYKVKGTEADGTEYETSVDVTKVDPSNASRVDMAALAAYLSKQGDTSGESFMSYSRREMDNYFSLPQNEQKNFKWKSLFAKENQYDDLNYIAQTFYKAGSMDGYMRVNNLIQNIKYQVKNF